mmetsp:Transcript_25490/g.63118  ORF Transcript_25490/g.63118 Transcript_25490/m.63118 type:complete len:260 (-) Transcript_25490:2217-2996(-)
MPGERSFSTLDTSCSAFSCAKANRRLSLLLSRALSSVCTNVGRRFLPSARRRSSSSAGWKFLSAVGASCRLREVVRALGAMARRTCCAVWMVLASSSVGWLSSSTEREMALATVACGRMGSRKSAAGLRFVNCCWMESVADRTALAAPPAVVRVTASVSLTASSSTKSCTKFPSGARRISKSSFVVSSTWNAASLLASVSDARACGLPGGGLARCPVAVRTCSCCSSLRPAPRKVDGSVTSSVNDVYPWRIWLTRSGSR